MSGRSGLPQINIQDHRKWFESLKQPPRSSTNSSNTNNTSDNNRNQQLQSQRSTANKNNIIKESLAKCGAIAGFEYAIQPDGTSLSETLWETNSNSSTSFFTPHANSNDTYRMPGQKVRLAQLQSTIQKSSFEFQKRSVLPPLPKQTATASASCTHNKQDSLAPLSPPLKIRNRHNAIYGQHLPNAMNSPGCAAKVFGNNAAQKDERQNIQNLFISTTQKMITNAPTTTTSATARATATIEILDDDDCDDHAAFDYGNDSTVATSTARSNRHASTPNANTNSSFEAHIDVDEDDIFANIDIDQMVAEHKSGKKIARPQNQYSSHDHSAGNDAAAAANLGTFSTADYETNHDYRSPLQQIDGNDQRYVSATDTISTHASASTSIYGHESGDRLMEPYRENTSGSNHNINRNGSNFDASFSSTSPPNHAPMFGQNTSIYEADGVPLCPGHNEPCLILTSNTATNSARQFYKCARTQGEQCDFFEWVDGIEGNANQGSDLSSAAVGMYDGGAFGPPPNSKDIFTENRRKFGHHSFRQGQKEVIQNAVNGKDAFVLMPTGGGKSLCYQLPAWCCPGIAVIVSPLLSLIEDQVQSMTKLGVETVFLSSQQDLNQQRDIMARLKGTTDHDGIKMLYVTPEKLSKSNVVRSLLRDLANRQLLSRFVVDEGKVKSTACGSLPFFVYSSFHILNLYSTRYFPNCIIAHCLR